MKLKFLTIIILVFCANLTGCSIYLEHAGWLDAPEQGTMYSAGNRVDFEKVAGDAILSKTLSNNRVLRMYEYFDGEKCVNTSYHPCDKMSEERGPGTAFSIMMGGMVEPIAYMRATGEREEGKVQVFVIYDIDDLILAICPSHDLRPTYPLQPNPLCESLWQIESIDNNEEILE
jgi:hypothetical protein